MPIFVRKLFFGRASQLARWVSLGLIAATMLGAVWATDSLHRARQLRSETESVASAEEKLRVLAVSLFQAVKTKITTADQLGADTTIIKEELTAIYGLIFDEADYFSAAARLVTLETTLNALIAERNAAIEAEKQQGTVTGLVREGTTPLSGVKVAVKNGSTELASTSTGTDGRYSLAVTAGTWTLVGSKSGYATYSKSKLAVTAGQTVTADFTLTKATSSSNVTPSTGTLTNGDSSYEVTTVNGHTVHLAKFNLSSGQFRVRTDTAADGDCSDNCPTKSLSSYVGDNGGFAGMNGTYFCPADYASCAGQVNSFFWKVYNTRLGKMINATNGLGEGDPFIAFNSSGTARYFSSWSSYGGSGFSAVAGINCKPALISGGNNILNVGSLDDKQRTTKSNRGAIGLKGQVLYLVIAQSATVVDLAGVMDTLDVDYAFNLDGGGSSAMIFNGSYKVGPGRSLPNAIIVTRS